MSFLLIPNEVTSQEANIWAGVINQELNPDIASLRYNNQEIRLNQNWISYRTKSGKNSIHYQHIRLQNLEPRTDYVLEFLTGTQVRATGQVRTLPIDLPTINERPFNVLLASCFASRRSESVHLGGSYLNLQRFEPTDIKILCGDQVYLDDPWYSFSFLTHSYNDLEDLLFSNYVKTWSQNRLFTGFQQFLQTGANFFSSDDHEFWNNAPNAATLIRDSWSQKGRDQWIEISKNLLDIFQSRFTKSAFNVGTLSFFIADTRVNRDAARNNFISQEDFLELENWVKNLNGVGVLVVGQPIFSEKAGFFGGRFGDWNLSNYKQYEDLVRVLMNSNHSILVLTGDVHYGRIAKTQIKQNVFLYEIISSPTALVNSKVGGKWHEAPGVFPIESIPGTVQKQVINNLQYRETENHFLTLSFYQDGLKTKIIPKVCLIKGNGQTPKPVKIDEFTLF